MLERNLVTELDELLKQNAQENFSRTISGRFSDKYKILGVNLDILMILPEMLQEDLIHYSLERSKQIVIELCVSECFEKTLLGYKTLSGMSDLLESLTGDEIWSIRPFENEYLIHVYFTHLIPVFLRENKDRYLLMNILLSSKKERIIELANRAIEIAGIQSYKPDDDAGVLESDIMNQLEVSEKNPINSKYFVA